MLQGVGMPGVGVWWLGGDIFLKSGGRRNGMSNRGRTDCEVGKDCKKKKRVINIKKKKRN